MISPIPSYYNCMYFLRHNNINISVAVDTAKGLITPVVVNADAKGLKQISSDMQTLRNKALEGKLMPEEYMVSIDYCYLLSRYY